MEVPSNYLNEPGLKYELVKLVFDNKLSFSTLNSYILTYGKLKHFKLFLKYKHEISGAYNAVLSTANTKILELFLKYGLPLPKNYSDMDILQGGVITNIKLLYKNGDLSRGDTHKKIKTYEKLMIEDDITPALRFFIKHKIKITQDNMFLIRVANKESLEFLHSKGIKIEPSLMPISGIGHLEKLKLLVKYGIEIKKEMYGIINSITLERLEYFLKKKIPLKPEGYYMFTYAKLSNCEVFFKYKSIKDLSEEFEHILEYGNPETLELALKNDIFIDKKIGYVVEDAKIENLKFFIKKNIPLIPEYKLFLRDYNVEDLKNIFAKKSKKTLAKK
jgi:hypothetical protein